MTYSNSFTALMVKITKSKYADDIQDGKIRMSSLDAYGAWGTLERANSDKAQDYKQGVQGDPMEGSIYIVEDIDKDPLFSSFPEEVRKLIIGNPYYLDESLRYIKLFCMYELKCNPITKKFNKPDDRIREFGDVAIIFNMSEFIPRLASAICYTYNNVGILDMHEVIYLPEDYTGTMNEFCKTAYFSWQNEFRIAFTPLDYSNFRVFNGVKEYKRICNTDAVFLDLGSLRDCTARISVDELINLEIPEWLYPNYYNINPPFAIW